MAHPDSDLIQDVMQVCLNGHVITDLACSTPSAAAPPATAAGRRRSTAARPAARRCPAQSAPGLATVGSAGRALLLRLRGGPAVGAAIQAGRRRPDGPAGTAAPPPAARGPSAALAAGRSTAFPGGR